ncbi:MAG: serine O-acetyltransferase EpsC [Bradyrhizobium sp.]
MAAIHPCVWGELGAKGQVAAAMDGLRRELELLCPERDPEAIVREFAARLPEVRRLVETDVTAAYEGDPAASSRMEVVMAYPGLFATTVHRLAHELYRLRVPIVPRVMSEIAHSRTGIDIHPGAAIGERFFIDHGTGVVIGETCSIGRNVKLYQGVTLGALSFDKDPVTGALVKGVKRHPDVEDNVVIYAGATILGGRTVIGHDSEIGGNVWIKDSVPPYSRVYNQPPAPVIRSIR